MEGGAQPTVARMAVSPGYFQTMEAPTVSGREFGEFDGPSNIPVAIVNEAFARRTWPADQALGKRLALFRDGVPLAWLTVVGVASDIIQDDRTRQTVEPLVYVPYQQRPQQNMFVFARLSRGPCDPCHRVFGRGLRDGSKPADSRPHASG